ncbi:MAG: cache domain-containing protein [Desulfonatronovibrionaceae bacterium]
MLRVFFVFSVFLFFGLFFAPAAHCQSAEELAETAREKASRSSDADLSWDEIYDKLDQACAMLQEDGLEEGLKQMQGDSPFVFKGTYIWVHDLDFTMLMHPMDPELVGENIKDYRDDQGKLLFQDMNERVEVSPEGVAFVDYYWPKPGVEDKSFPKRSIVSLCEVEGKEVVLGCGKYLD